MEERLHAFYTSALTQKTDLLHVTAALPPRGKKPVLYTEPNLGGPFSLSEHFAEKANTFPLPGIEHRVIGCRACSPVITPTELPQHPIVSQNTPSEEAGKQRNSIVRVGENEVKSQLVYLESSYTEDRRELLFLEKKYLNGYER